METASLDVVHYVCELVHIEGRFYTPCSRRDGDILKSGAYTRQRPSGWRCGGVIWGPTAGSIDDATRKTTARIQSESCFLICLHKVCPPVGSVARALKHPVQRRVHKPSVPQRRSRAAGGSIATTESATPAPIRSSRNRRFESFPSSSESANRRFRDRLPFMGQVIRWGLHRGCRIAPLSSWHSGGDKRMRGRETDGRWHLVPGCVRGSILQ